LRQRYYAALQKPATSGNIYHYEQWATECAGVKAAKVFPLWNGANTVKVIIIDDEGEPASAELVAAVQAYIDPGISGNGSGAAPIGAYCTVAAADGVALTIAVTVQIVVGYTQEEVEENITAQIRAYLNEIAFQQDYVSYGKIAACIIDAEGVEDYSNLTMNDGMENITLSETEVATLGTVTISNA
jgi:uncharacterized phage protein gp47/JayE